MLSSAPRVLDNRVLLAKPIVMSVQTSGLSGMFTDPAGDAKVTPGEVPVTEPKTQ